MAIEAAELCPRFCARVLDVRLGPSPAFMRDRLEQVGVRPINNVVDLTNYVMMEMGHPSHAFDLAAFPRAGCRCGGRGAGETLTTLDGVERDPRADHGRGGRSARRRSPSPGVMGGATSEVSDGNDRGRPRGRLLGSARRSAAPRRPWACTPRPRIASSAAPTPRRPPSATARIAHLLEKIGAGRARPGLIETLGPPAAAADAQPAAARIDRCWDAAVPRERTHAILASAGLRGRRASGRRRLRSRCPSWRGDVAREIDLVEEVGRHHGLDQIAADLPAGPPSRRPRAVARPASVACASCCVGAGLSEAVNLGLVDERRRPRLRHGRR